MIIGVTTPRYKVGKVVSQAEGRLLIACLLLLTLPLLRLHTPRLFVRVPRAFSSSMDTLLLLLRSISILSIFHLPPPLFFVHHANHEQIGTMLLYSAIVLSLFVLSRLFLNMVGRRLGSFYRIRRIDLGDESRYTMFVYRIKWVCVIEIVLQHLHNILHRFRLLYWNSAKGFFSIFKITTISLFLPLSFRKFHIPDGKKISLSSQKKKKKKILRRLKENVLSLWREEETK